MPALFAHVPHPVVLAGRAVAFFDRKLNREIRSEASRRDARDHHCDRAGRRRGSTRAGGRSGCAAAAPLGAAVEILLIAILVAQRSLFEHVAAVARALAGGGLAAGRDAVRHIVGRDPLSLDALRRRTRRDRKPRREFQRRRRRPGRSGIWCSDCRACSPTRWRIRSTA